MSKKIISLALALIMCLALVPMTALAAGVTLSLDQTDYKAGGLITITYSGVTNEQIAAQAVVAFAKQGAPASKYDKWTYVKENSGTVTLWASSEAGNYEMRFYQGRSINETNLVSSATATFTIGGGSETTTPPTTQPPATTTPPVTQPPVTQPTASKGLTATPTASAVLVNGKSVAFDAYNIGGNNYFKLRDLAYTLNGTAKQFSVSWDDAANAIMLTSGQGYVATGGEMSGKGGGAKTAVPTTSKIIKDGKEASFTAYNIDGSNYFKLRDIGQAFNFGVDWDGAKNTIVIDTGKGYAAEGQTPVTPPATTKPPKPTDPPVTTNNTLAGTVWSKYPDQMDWWYGKMDGIEQIIPKERSYANGWIFNSDGTFVLTMRWLTGYGTAYQMGGVLVTRGKYQVISDTKFKLTDMSTNRTTGPYYGTVTGWFDEKGEINCEYEFFTDSDGEGIKIKMDGVGIIVKDSPLGEYDNTWSNYWKRSY